MPFENPVFKNEKKEDENFNIELLKTNFSKFIEKYSFFKEKYEHYLWLEKVWDEKELGYLKKIEEKEAIIRDLQNQK